MALEKVSDESFGSNERERRYLKVEPALFMFMLAYGVTLPLRTEYLKERFAKDSGLPTTDLNADCHMNKSDPMYPILQDVNSKTAYWSVYLAFAISLPALFSSNYLGSVSDSRGRKLPMYVTLLGLTIYSVLHLFVVHFQLSLHILALASFVLGCCGDLITFMSCGFAYVADTTTLSSRIFRIVLAETLITVGGGPGQIGAGYLIDIFGFEGPYVFILLCALVTALYLLWLPESVEFDDERKGKSQYNPRAVLAAMRELLRPRPGGRLWKLLAYNTIVFVYIMNGIGFIGVSVLYITAGDPFCFNHQQVGYFEAAQFILSGVGMFLGGALLPLFLSDLTVIHISNLGFFANLFLTAIVQTEIGLYGAAVLSLVRLLALPLSRARMSKLVQPSEQGVMFAVSGCVQSVSLLAGIPALQAIFPWAYSVYPGLIFIIMSLFMIPPAILTIILHVQDNKRSPTLIYKRLSDDEDIPGSVHTSTLND
ncbi:Proton-coupled folate transporter [Holothuria leucospilota]|uniref:Proton-coupled folate transporter n=1 Tax=Holothuria leucospilota TaxID=206669 RepID=A0A9Q1CQU5_HOLLE|nr:Proton-coupled folate transporter [Holothuria leucospilota]